MSDVFNFKSEVSKNAGNFEPLPVNRYTLKVIEAKAALSKEKQTPQIAVQFQVMDAPYEKRKLFHNFTWSAKAVPFVFSFLKAVKSPVIDEDNVSQDKAVSGMLGGVCTAYVDIETTTAGGQRNKISNFKEIEGGSAPVGQTASQSATTGSAPVAGGAAPMFV